MPLLKNLSTNLMNLSTIKRFGENCPKKSLVKRGKPALINLVDKNIHFIFVVVFTI